MWRKGPVAGVLVVLVAAPAHAGCGDQQAAAGPGKVQLVLDSSGSMAEPDASGKVKIDAAKQALNAVVDELPAKAHVGMRVYGASDFAESDPRACRDSRQVVPVGPADKPALRRAISEYQPVGWTPIAYALEQAAKDLGSEGARSIILVSDGEETCDRDPVEVARQLRQRGIDLKIDVVGFDVSGTAREQLERIADAGGGIYYNATDADVLDQSALRPFRPFTVQGTPVGGSLEPAEAPELEPGQYRDTLGPADDVTGLKYYTLNVTPGATVRAGVTLRPVLGGRDPVVRTDALDLRLYVPGEGSPNGLECTSSRASRAEGGPEQPLLSGSIFFGADGDSDIFDADPPCYQADQMILEVARGDYDDQRTQSPNPTLDPMELVVSEEPPVASLDGLPGPASEADNRARPVPLVAPQRKVVGGPTFNDVPALTPGSWKDTIQPGEQLVYGVRADWGQAPAVSFRLPPNPRFDGGGATNLAVYSPDRFELATTLLPGTEHASTWSSDDDLTLHTGLPPVRYRNREYSSDAIKTVSLAGVYYFSIEMTDEGGCWQTPIEINVALDGEAEGEPSYEEPEPELGPSPDAGTEDGGEYSTANGSDSGSDDDFALKAAVGTIAGGALLAGAGFAILLLRRPRRAKQRP